MTCDGCGNTQAYITRTICNGTDIVTICDLKACGDLRTPWVPDVFFPQPHFSEHLGDQSNPQGTFINSRREKARLLQAQGLRETGDRVHGSLHRDAVAPKRDLKPEFKEKVKKAVWTAIKKTKRKA